eukprot:maker-scaffold459_size165548-snap-gene-0.23 protein:Tk05713 transcript:maker-scaffold459_size165548-snap-gene-0.23-mRNA-1 annotation:"camp-specific -cyclic"
MALYMERPEDSFITSGSTTGPDRALAITEQQASGLSTNRHRPGFQGPNQLVPHLHSLPSHSTKAKHNPELSIEKALPNLTEPHFPHNQSHHQTAGGTSSSGGGGGGGGRAGGGLRAPGGGRAGTIITGRRVPRLMASQGNIGRLPTGPAAVNTFSEDDELELLELQLLTTQVTACPSLTSARFTPKDQGLSATFPRKAKDRRSLMTLWADRGLLDEIQSEQIHRILLNITHWDFNAFTLDRFTCGNNLSTLCVHLFKEHGLLHHFQLDALVVWKFFALVEQGYYSSNPYHNGVHAADVTQAMNCFLQQSIIRKHLTPLELMSAIVAAHDLDAMDHMVREIILATDISRQAEFLTQLRSKLDTDELDMSHPEDRLFIIQIAMKCADISNPCRSWNISRLWSYRASEEFFRQGDSERNLGLPVTPFCDRFNITVAKVQSGFYRFVAFPLFEEWHRFLASPLTLTMVRNLTTNQARWDLIMQQEANRGAMLDSTHSTSSSSTSCSHPVDSRRESLEPPPSHHRLSRSSADDEDSDPCISYPYMPLDHEFLQFPRRHSLPISNLRSRLHSRRSADDSTDEPCPSLAPNHSPLVHGERKRPVSTGESGQAPQRRKLFAASRSPIPTLESESYGSSLDSSTHLEANSGSRVTFSFGPKDDDDSFGERDDDFDAEPMNAMLSEENKENLNVRRGSAPGSLLLHQLANLTFNKSISRETSPNAPLRSRNRNLSGGTDHSSTGSRMSKLALSNRRGSLPADFMEHASLLDNHRSSSCGRYAKDQSELANLNVIRKQQIQTILRQRSGEANLNLSSHTPHISTSSSSPHCLDQLGSYRQLRLVRRGSLRSGGNPTVTSSSRLSSRRGSAPLDTDATVLQNLSALASKSNTAANEEEPSIINNNRHQLHHNNNNNNNTNTKYGHPSTVDYLHNMEAMARAQVLRNAYLSSSVETELLEDMQSTFGLAHGHRRGSLPTEFLTSIVQ